MKKYGYLLVILAFVIAFTGCGKKKEKQTEQTKIQSVQQLGENNSVEIAVKGYPMECRVPADWRQNKNTNYDLECENDYINFYLFAYHVDELNAQLSFEDVYKSQVNEWADKLQAKEDSLKSQPIDDEYDNISMMTFQSVYEDGDKKTEFMNYCYLVTFLNTPDYMVCVLINGDTEYMRDHEAQFFEVMKGVEYLPQMVVAQDTSPKNVSLTEYGISFVLPAEYSSVSEAPASVRGYSDTLACYAYGYDVSELEEDQSPQDMIGKIKENMLLQWDEVTEVESPETTCLNGKTVTSVLYETMSSYELTWEYVCLVEFDGSDRFVIVEFSGDSKDVASGRKSMEDVITSMQIE